MDGRGWLVGAVLGLVAGCGSGNAGALDVGGSDAAPQTFHGGDASGGVGALDAYVEEGKVAVTFVTVTCSNQCATVQAVPTGGYAPYTFAWDDGTTSATRRVCPAADTTYSVRVTDTGSTGEFPRAPQTVQVTLPASVLACSDGGASTASSCDGGAGPAVPSSGLYAGTFYCPPGPDGGIDALPAGLDGGLITGDVWIQLSIDPSTGQQTGMLYGKWVVLGVIAYQAELQGALDCSTGAFQGTWVDGEWGLPGPVAADAGAPISVIPVGYPTGDLTAAVVAGSPGTIAGHLDWFSTSTDNGSTCTGTYTATLMP